MQILLRRIKISDSGRDGLHIKGDPDNLIVEDMEINNSGRHAIYYESQNVDALELLEKALQKIYTKDDKQELLDQVARATKLAKENPQANKHKILSILNNMLPRLSDIASIGSFALAIIQSFHTGPPIDPMLLVILKQRLNIS